MRRTKSFYQADAEFDIIQKTKNNKTNFRINNGYDDLENQLDNTQANSYLSGLVKEMKETMLNVDDNIFNQINQSKQKKNSDYILSVNYIGGNKLKKVTTLNKTTTLLSNRSGKSTKSKRTYGPKSNRMNTRHHSSKSNKNGSKSNRMNTRHYSSKSNKNGSKSNRTNTRHNTSKSNKNGSTSSRMNNRHNSNNSNKNGSTSSRMNNRHNSNNSNKNGSKSNRTVKKNINFENKNNLPRNLSLAKDILLRKEKEKLNKISSDNSENPQNLSFIGLRHMNSINAFTKKSSFKPKEIKRLSFFMNPSPNFLKPIRTTTMNKNPKSVKFDIPKRTSTLYEKNKPKKNINKNVRRWSEIKDRRKSTRENNLFSFFQRPEYFEEPKNNYQKNINLSSKRYSSVSIHNDNDNDNEELFKISQLSNKNILQLNEISRSMRKSICLSNNSNLNFKLSDLDKKNFLHDEDSSQSSNGSSEESNKEKVDEEQEIIDKEKYRELQRKGTVYDSLDEYNDDDISTFFIHPDSEILKILDCTVTFCVVYNLIEIPFFLGNNEIYCRIGSYFSFSNLIELLIDLIYFIDFVVHFFVGFYNNEDVLQTNLIDIIINNLQGWFIIDLMGVIPFKTLFSIYDTKCQDISFLSSYKYQSQFYYLFICFRLVKTFRLHNNKFLQYCDEILDKYEHYNNYLSFYLGFIIFCITIHIVTCLLIFIGRNDYPSWIIYFNFSEYNFAKLYFIGIYYIITTVTTVGYGDLTCITPKEKIFGILVEIVGIIAYSWVVSSISNYVKSKSDAEEEYFKKYQILEKIKMTYKDFSDDLFERIDRYLKHKQNNEEQEKNLIEELPISLKNTLVYSMFEPIIQNFIFFKNFDNKDFIVKVIFCFKPIMAIRNDILIKDGDFVEDIIFVKKGKLSLELSIKLTPDNPEQDNNSNKLNMIHTNYTNQNINQMKTQTTKFANFMNNMTSNEEESEEEEIIEYQNFKILDIRKNEHFGDVLMISNERSPLTAIVKSRKAELFYLNKKDALEISTSYPQIWTKIQKKSLFNMKQIKRLMAKVIKIFQNTYGMTSRKDEISNSDISKSEYELQPIPTISEYNETNIDNNKNYRNKYSNNNIHDEIKNLKTIEEGTFIEDESENSNSDISKSKISNTLTHNLERINETDSSNFNNKKSNRDNLTIKMENCSNGNIDFSDVFSMNSKNFLTGRSLLTPYKPEEINMEIYPNEKQNFMQFKHSENFNNINNDYFTNIYNNNNNENYNNSIKISINNNNISMCSTEISFSINSKYENIDELSDYRYSKTPKLRKRIKSLLKDPDFENDFVYNKYKSNKTTLKNSNISINSLNLPQRKKTIKKSCSQELKDKKRKNQHEKNRKSENDVTLTSLKNNPKNLLNMIHEKNNQDSINVNEPPTFTELIQNFLDKEKLTNNKELQEQKVELNKKIQNIRSMKEQNRNFLKNKFVS